MCDLCGKKEKAVGSCAVNFCRAVLILWWNMLGELQSRVERGRSQKNRNDTYAHCTMDSLVANELSRDCRASCLLVDSRQKLVRSCRSVNQKTYSSLNYVTSRS